MTTNAGGVTGAEDDSLSATGATVAGGGIGAPKAVPLALHDIELFSKRSREGNDSVHRALRNRQSVNDDAVCADRAQRATLAVSGPMRIQPNDIGYSGRRQGDPGESRDLLQAVPRAPKVQMTSAEAEHVVKSARALAAGKVPKLESQDDYLGKAKWLWAQVEHSPELPDGERWCLALDAYVARPATYRAYKAACCWHIRAEVIRRLAEQNRLQHAGERGDAWLRQIAMIQQLLRDHHAVKSHLRPGPELLCDMVIPESRSKKADLRRIFKKFPDWMARILLGTRHTKYRDAVRLLCLVGPRPEELLTGAELAWSTPGTFSITLNGAKVGDSAGQPWRRVHLPESLLPRAWRHRLQINGKFLVTVESKDGLRKCLQRVSESALPGLPFATAYVFRHAFATRLRDSGFNSEEIAAFMGHSVAETQAVYGMKAGGRGKRRIKRATGLRVEVPRAVRPIDRSGLEKIQAAKSARKRKAGPAAR